ncbi:MAG: SNF2-related protein [Planctomycetota bacterium]
MITPTVAVVFVPALVAAAVAAATGVYALYRRTPLSRARRRGLRAARVVRKAHARQVRARNRYARRIRRAAGPYQEVQQQQRWAQAPLAVLRDHGATGVRWSVLDEAGIERVGDLAARDDSDLQELKGLGEKGVGQLRQAADRFHAQLGREPVRAPSADLTDRSSLRLARELLRMLRFRSEVGEAAARLAAASRSLEEPVAAVRRSTGVLGWIRSWWRPERRAAAIAAAQQLADDADGFVAQGLLEEVAAQQDVAKRAAGKRLSRKAIEATYRKEQAAAAAALDDALSAAVDSKPQVHATDSQLDPALLATIEGTALHSEVMNIGLRRYQQFGTRFLLACRRTVLGDEMGLGKTVQALAAMAQLYAETGSARFLVIAPAGILLNWRQEVEAKSFLRPRVAHGSGKEQALAEWLQLGGVLIVSYATLRSFDVAAQLDEAATRDAAAGRIDLVIADEAHYVKNPEAQRTAAVATLLERARRVCLMTGTPMENHPKEFARLIELLGRDDWNVTEDELSDPDSGAVSQQFRSNVARIYLRRNQEDVLQELPEKIVVDEWIDLHAAQWREYQDAVRAANFMGMRQAVTLPVGAASSAKLDRVAELLDEHRESGRRVIVFSFFRKVLEELDARFDSVGTIHGGVSQDRRGELIEEFGAGDGHSLLLAQITAAGHGLNLQMASVIVLMEPQLTPGAEAQAIARAHRMGQTERVLVHRLVAADTVDARLVEILARKQDLFDEYARPSVAKENNPEAVETQVVRTIIDLERQRWARDENVD